MSRWADLYLEGEAKSAGWVPGVVQLAPAASVRVGLVVLP